MADNESDDNKCPLCGRDTKEGETFCDDCQEIANNSYPSELLAHGEPDDILPIDKDDDILTENLSVNVQEENDIPEPEENQEQTTKPKSNKKLLIFLAIGLVLMVLVGGIGSYVFIQNKNAEETQEAYWNRCIDENTPLAYSKYLVQYPDGKYSVQAQDKIIELRETERKEWDKLRKSSNVEALFGFLRDHPDTPYAREIRHAIDSISWIATLKINSADAYMAYIDNSKLGRYSGEYVDLAQQKYDYISQLKVVEGEELKEVNKVLTDFFKALSSTDSKDIQKATVTVLNKFYTSAHQESKLIADSVKTALKKNKIRKVSYTPQVNSAEVIQDNKGIYFITLPLTTETTFTDRKKKKETSKYVLNIEMDKNKLIRSIEKKGK